MANFFSSLYNCVPVYLFSAHKKSIEDSGRKIKVVVEINEIAQIVRDSQDYKRSLASEDASLQGQNIRRSSGRNRINAVLQK